MQFEGVVGEQVQRFLLREQQALEGILFVPYDLSHLRLYPLVVAFVYHLACGRVEVVEEAVLRRRPCRQQGLRVRQLNCIAQHVCRRMPINALCLLEVHKLQLAIRVERSVQVHPLCVCLFLFVCYLQSLRHQSLLRPQSDASMSLCFSGYPKELSLQTAPLCFDCPPIFVLSFMRVVSILEPSFPSTSRRYSASAQHISAL